MNHYFSRLAQRSSIATTNPVRQSRAVNTHAAHADSASDGVISANSENSIDAWGEQNIELSSSGQVQTNPEKIDKITRATPRNSNDQSNLVSPVNTQAVSKTPVNADVNSIRATAPGLQSTLAPPQSFAADVHYDVDALASVLEHPLPTSHYLQHKTAPSLPGVSSVNNITAMQRDESDNFPEKNIHTGHRKNIPVSAAPHSKTVTVEAVQRHSNTIEMDNGNTQGAYGRRMIEEIQNKKQNARHDSEAQPTSVVASPNHAGRTTANSVAATPSDIPTALTNMPDAASRSGVQVNIGKIELEIFAPQKKVVQAPLPPVVPAIKPVPREPAFNLHRHYLRSR